MTRGYLNFWILDSRRVLHPALGAPGTQGAGMQTTSQITIFGAILKKGERCYGVRFTGQAGRFHARGCGWITLAVRTAIATQSIERQICCDISWAYRCHPNIGTTVAWYDNQAAAHHMSPQPSQTLAVTSTSTALDHLKWLGEISVLHSFLFDSD